MGFFSKMLEKLGFHSDVANAAAATPASADASGAPTPPPSADTPKPMDVVDVVAQLEQRAATKPQALNWQTSIVDLLKLLDMDSSLEARRELAAELGCPPSVMADSASMNMWLHKEVLSRIAANGGNVPANLLH